KAERAALDIDVHRAEGRARGQRDDVNWSRRGALQLSEREPQHVALQSDRQETRGMRRCGRRSDRAERLGEPIRIVRLDGRGPPGAETQAGEDRLSKRER